MSGAVHSHHRTPAAPSAPRDVVVAAAVAVLAGAAAWGVAPMGQKGVLAAVGGLAVAGSFALTRRRTELALALSVLSLNVLLHKAIGSKVTELSQGPNAVYVTSHDLTVMILYGWWALEGTLRTDLMSALRRPVVWMPLAAAPFTLLSVVAAPNTRLVAAELVRMGASYLLFLYLAARIRERREVLVVFGALAATVFLQFAVVVMQWRTGGVLGLSFLGIPTELGERTLDGASLGRPFGTMIHPVFMGAVLGMLALVALSVGLHATGRTRRIALAVVPLALAPLVISHARAATLAFAGAALVIGVLAFARRLLPRRAVVRTAVVLGVLAAMAFPYARGQFLDNFATEHFELEVQSRVELNAVAVDVFRDAPIIGIGLNNFEQVQEPYEAERFGVIFATHPVHNLFLLQAAETGIVGLLALLLVGCSLLVVAWRLGRSRDPLLRAIGVGMVAVLAFMALEEQLGFSLRHDVPRTIFWLLAGLTAAGAAMDPGPGRTARWVPLRGYLLSGGRTGGGT